jgi:hypothetical protein
MFISEVLATESVCILTSNVKLYNRGLGVIHAFMLVCVQLFQIQNWNMNSKIIPQKFNKSIEIFDILHILT